MLTPGQEKYLSTFSDAESVEIRPFNPLAREIGNTLIKQIQNVLPATEIYYIGSSVFGIAGENDVDISMVSSGIFEEEVEKLSSLLGEPSRLKEDKKRAEWKFVKNDIPVEVYLNDTITPLLADQIKTHELLQNSPALLREYENLKIAFNNKPRKAYMQAKMDFFNRVLANSSTR